MRRLNFNHSRSLITTIGVFLYLLLTQLLFCDDVGDPVLDQAWSDSDLILIGEADRINYTEGGSGKSTITLDILILRILNENLCTERMNTNAILFQNLFEQISKGAVGIQIEQYESPKNTITAISQKIEYIFFLEVTDDGGLIGYSPLLAPVPVGDKILRQIQVLEREKSSKRVVNGRIDIKVHSADPFEN